MRIIDFIGKTPLVRVEKNLFLKIEGRNPTGSIKDRAALYMLRGADLSVGSRIVEPTSGNMGISLCFLSAVMGYRATIVMPEGMSEEREKMMLAYGGRVVKVPGGMRSALERAREIASSCGAFMPGQFNNPENERAHFETTGPEIFMDTKGCVDIVVAGVGTAGTIMGVAKYLKAIKPRVKVVAVEPITDDSGCHKIQGIGAGFLPPLYDESVVDSTVYVSYDDAAEWTVRLAKKHGIFAGISSGAAMYAANIQSLENPDKTVVAILPDTANRYLSLGLFS